MLFLFRVRPRIPNILDIININDKSVIWILDQLDVNTDIFKKFTGVVTSLKDGMTEIPTGNPATFGIPLMKRLLASQGFKSLTGGVSEMASQLISAPESSKMLLNFIHLISLILND